MELLKELIDFDEVFCGLLCSFWVLWVSWDAILVTFTKALILWLVVEQTRSAALQGHIQLLVLPQIEIECSLPHPAMSIENVNHCAGKWSLRLLHREIIYRDAHMSIRRQVTNSNRELDFLIELKARQDTRLHLRLVELMVEPKLHHNHNLQIDVDILNLVPFIICKIIFNLLSANIVEFADLIKCIHANLFKSFSVLPLRKQRQLVVHISQKVQLESKLFICDLSVLYEDAFIRRVSVHRLLKLCVRATYFVGLLSKYALWIAIETLVNAPDIATLRCWVSSFL